MAPFLWTGFNCLKSTEPLQGSSLLFITQFWKIFGTHLINLGRMKGWLDLGATPWMFNTGPFDWGSSALTSRPDFVFSLVIFNENEARYVILGTLTLLTIKNIINYFVCLVSLGIFQGSALTIFFLCYFSENVSKRSILGLLGLNNFI